MCEDFTFSNTESIMKSNKSIRLVIALWWNYTERNRCREEG